MIAEEPLQIPVDHTLPAIRSQGQRRNSAQHHVLNAPRAPGEAVRGGGKQRKLQCGSHGGRPSRNLLGSETAARAPLATTSSVFVSRGALAWAPDAACDCATICRARSDPPPVRASPAWAATLPPSPTLSNTPPCLCKRSRLSLEPWLLAIVCIACDIALAALRQSASSRSLGTKTGSSRPSDVIISFASTCDTLFFDFGRATAVPCLPLRTRRPTTRQ